MSGAEGWSRRAVMAGAVALGILPELTRAQGHQAPVSEHLGIRYARAERFQPPVPVPWEGSALRRRAAGAP